MSSSCYALARLTLVLADRQRRRSRWSPTRGGRIARRIVSRRSSRTSPSSCCSRSIGTVLLREQLLTTSAVGAVVVGFALQDTLGNLFAGLAIQIEKPFRVGQWMQVGDREGQVQEITWRATKLRTKAGQFLIVPNSVISKEPVLNYSEPTMPTRIEVEVGASYSAPPNDVKRAMQEAMANCAAGDEGAGAAGDDHELRRLGDRLRRAVLDRGLRDRSRPRAIRCAPISGTRSAATTSRFRIRSRSSTSATEEPIRTERHVAAAAEHLGRRQPVQDARRTRRARRWRRPRTQHCSPPARRSCARTPTATRCSCC